MKKKKVLPIIIGVIVIAAVLSNMKGKPKTGDAAVRSDTSIIVRNETKKDQNKTTTAPAEQADTTKEMTATEILARNADMLRILGATYGRLLHEFIRPLCDRGLQILSRRGVIEHIVLNSDAELKYIAPITQMAIAENMI